MSPIPYAFLPFHDHKLSQVNLSIRIIDTLKHLYQGIMYTYCRKRFTQYLHNTIKFVPAIYSVYQHNLNPNLECNNVKYM